MSEVASHGEKFEPKLTESLPEGTIIIAKSNDMDTGSLKVILFNEAWDEVPNGESLKKVIVELSDKPTSSIIALP
jgi:hypothetical protein